MGSFVGGRRNEMIGEDVGVLLVKGSAGGRKESGVVIDSFFLRFLSFSFFISNLFLII